MNKNSHVQTVHMRQLILVFVGLLLFVRGTGALFSLCSSCTDWNVSSFKHRLLSNSPEWCICAISLCKKYPYFLPIHYIVNSQKMWFFTYRHYVHPNSLYFHLRTVMIFFLKYKTEIIQYDNWISVIFLPAHPESCTHIFALGLTF